MSPEPTFVDGPNGKLGLLRTQAADPSRPGLLWLGGFMSDMSGTKAAHLHAAAEAAGLGYLRFDYTGHGVSERAFTEGCIGDWAADARFILETQTEGPQILIGSSMGGWISLLLARALPERLAGLVLIAPAPDFTERRMWAEMTDEQKADLEREGMIRVPSDYDPAGYPLTKRLIEDGRRHLLLGGEIPFAGPVRILHGVKDADVDWRQTLELAEKLTSEDVTVTLIKDGDHRLSEPDNLNRLQAAVLELASPA